MVHVAFTSCKWSNNNQERLPLFEFDLVQRTHRPLARLRFKIALPLVVLILLRKPWVRARDFLDLFLFVWQSAAFPALTTRPRRLSVVVPRGKLKFKVKDEPGNWNPYIREGTDHFLPSFHHQWAESNNISFSKIEGRTKYIPKRNSIHYLKKHMNHASDHSKRNLGKHGAQSFKVEFLLIPKQRSSCTQLRVENADSEG